jgi:hypothetical protein
MTHDGRSIRDTVRDAQEMLLWLNWGLTLHRMRHNRLMWREPVDYPKSLGEVCIEAAGDKLREEARRLREIMWHRRRA